ncbi:KOW motif-containing protein [Candidatus Woesearchaeota archaeon]|nr:KOW motif-containing protein [Candidatus Woesearchaeota archaeon]
MFEKGRLCKKIAGRDKGEYGIILEVLGKDRILIDGNTRRRKTNRKHVEPLEKKYEIGKDTTTQKVQEILKKEGIPIKKKVKKEKQKTQKPEKNRGKKQDKNGRDRKKA